MKSIIGLAILGGVVYGVYAINGATRTMEGKSVLHVAKELEVSVRTTRPETFDIVRTVQAPGAVEPFADVDISAEVVGKITELPVEEGDTVKKGQLLCRLDDAVYRARVLSAEANVVKLKANIEQGEAEFEKADRDMKRQVRLSEENATSDLELADYHTALIRARTLVDMRRQELVQAEAALKSAQEDLQKTVITAPIDGVVSQLFAEQGEVVITGTMNNAGTRIMVVSDLSKMQVRCRVDEQDAPLVGTEQSARIYLQSDTKRAVPGHVFRVATTGTKQQGRDVVTFETLVLVDSQDKSVKPGMTASVEIEVDRSTQAVTIPVQAIVERKRRDLPEELVRQYDAMQSRLSLDRRGQAAEYIPIAFVVDNDVAHPRLVEIGLSDDQHVEIVSGVSKEDTVVSGPYRSLDQLKDGSKIKIETEAKTELKPTEQTAENKTNGGGGSTQ